MAKTFDQLVKEHGSVAAALKAQGYTKDDSGSWSSSGGSSAKKDSGSTAKQTGASSATISRVNRALNYGVEGYHQVFARVLGDECVPPTAEKGRKAGRKKKTEDA